VDIRIDRDSTVPIYLQICSGIKEMILSGMLPEGFRLPPERRLAAALGVNRSTILSAYRELKADALVGAHVGRGTTVVPRRFAGHRGRCSLPGANSSAGSTGQDPCSDLLRLSERSDDLAVGRHSPPQSCPSTRSALSGKNWCTSRRADALHSPPKG
jgi:DNA-binding GntR family transcriptional regulator